MDGPTSFLEIPGYADALRREDRLRRQAWTNPGSVISGVSVRPLTWRDVEELAEMRNGFFCPWRFDTDTEYLGHCAHLVWWLSECRKPARGDTRIGTIIVEAQKARLIRHLGKHAKETADGVMQFLSDTFADGPRGSGSVGTAGPVAGGPAYIADTLAAAGYRFSLDEMLDMPLTQLFQILRLARRRVYGEKISNPSDRLACEYVAALGGRN